MMPKLFKARSFWIVIAICAAVAVLILAALLPAGDPGDNVEVGLAGFTNQAGRKIAVFQGTNNSNRAMTYEMDVKTNFPHPYYPQVLMTMQKGGPIAPGQSFTVTMDAPAETANWEPVFLYRLVWNKREERRWSLAEFLDASGMSALAEDIKPSQAEGSILLNPSQKHERWCNKPGFPD